jgi:6-phosphogluconolactonase
MEQQIIMSPPCEIRMFGSPGDLAKAAAQDWFEFLQVMSLAGREPSVALSGGRIARVFFEEAARVIAGQEALARQAHYFWADERCVPADHAESNYALASRGLLRPAGVPEVNIHRIPGEFGGELAAKTAGRGLMKWTGTDIGEAPVLDLVLLGMGQDGHVASLFPGETSDVMDSPQSYRAVTAPKPPPERVTISYNILARADAVWLLASGDGKEEALKSALTSADSPLGRVLRSRSGTRIYTDLRPESGFEGQSGGG